MEGTTNLIHRSERRGNCELVRVEFHQTLFRIKVSRVSAHCSDSPWSKPFLLMSGVAVVLQFRYLTLPRYHHVGSRHAKVVRPCRRSLQPDTKELKTKLTISLSCSKEVDVDQQLDPLVVDPLPLLLISM